MTREKIGSPHSRPMFVAAALMPVGMVFYFLIPEFLAHSV
jgi:hypothetical protein